MIADRLASIANKIVSPQQYGFINGRQIQSCIAAASDTVNLLYKQCFCGIVIFKVDIRKAFDPFNWSFLLEVLKSFRISSNFYSWISSIFSSSQIFIFINGSPQGYFSCSRRVRQDDTLSPLLFCLAEDFLSRMITYFVNSGGLLPMLATRTFYAPSHLFYVDDILIFCRGMRSNVQKLVQLFSYYGEILNQRGELE